jgi:hypothetical protein
MLPFLTVIVLIGSFVGTFALMRGLQRMQGPVVRPAPGLPGPGPRPAAPVGPDDDLAFLRELRRRIDLGHFRH